MNSRERVLAALNHEESDRIPLDLGGTTVTGIHVEAYQKLRDYLGLPAVEVELMDLVEQLAAIDEDLVEYLGCDCKRLAPGLPSGYERVFEDQGRYVSFDDEWSIGWRKPKDGGLYYDMWKHPLADVEIVDDLEDYEWPDPTDPQRFEGMRECAEAYRADGKAVVLAPHCVGPTEMHAFLRGWETYYLDLGLRPELVEFLMEKIVDLKEAYWRRALEEVGDYVDVVMEADDMAGQDRLLMSPETYRTLIKPAHARLFSFIKSHTDAKLFLHTCGAIRPLIPDLIECGVDILNPVQKSAAGMDFFELKREFGQDLVFWGGGVDTQRVFGAGSPVQVRADVEENLRALAPGGGFVFATVHNTQPNVPPENFMAAWHTMRSYTGG